MIVVDYDDDGMLTRIVHEALPGELDERTLVVLVVVVHQLLALAAIVQQHRHCLTRLFQPRCSDGRMVAVVVAEASIVEAQHERVERRVEEAVHEDGVAQASAARLRHVGRRQRQPRSPTDGEHVKVRLLPHESALGSVDADEEAHAAAIGLGHERRQSIERRGRHDSAVVLGRVLLPQDGQLLEMVLVSIVGLVLVLELELGPRTHVVQRVVLEYLLARRNVANGHALELARRQRAAARVGTGAGRVVDEARVVENPHHGVEHLVVQRVGHDAMPQGGAALAARVLGRLQRAVRVAVQRQHVALRLASPPHGARRNVLSCKYSQATDTGWSDEEHGRVCHEGGR